MPLTPPSLSRRAMFGAAAVVIATTGIATAASRASTPALVQLPSVQLAHLDLLTSVAAPADHVLSLGVALAHSNVAAENAYLRREYTPGNADYHRFLTPGQVAARFGVPSTRLSIVTSLLRSAGIKVTRVSTARDYLSATGTVAQVEKAFHVTERVYTVPASSNAPALSFVANSGAPSVPAAAGITTIVGLNTLQRFSTLAAPTQDICEAGPCTGETTPQDLWSVYSQPNLYRGQGGTIGIIGEGVTKPAIDNLRVAEKAYGLPQTPIVVKCVQGAVAGGDCGTKDDGGTGEWQIDTQASTGMAPDVASETLYWAKTIYDADLNNSFVAWVDDATGPKVASASLGECEAGPLNGQLTSGPLGNVDGNLNGDPTSILALGNGEATAVDPVLKNAVMQGKTLFASSGDTGSSCPVVYLPGVGGANGVANQGVPQQNYPAVSPYVVGVGGTVLYTNDNGESAGDSYKPNQPPATRASEIAWTHGGGGASLYIPEPDWQKADANVNRPCVIGADGSTSTTGATCRGVPDVASQSGDIFTNGYSIGTTTGFTSGGGTSLSAPLWAGMWTRVAAATGYTIGFAAPALYKAGLNTTSYARDFTDVTVGANGAYTAGPGWDYNTGFGTPLVDGLLCDIDGLPSGRFAAGLAGVCPLKVDAKPGAKIPGSIVTIRITNAVGGHGLVVRVKAKKKVDLEGQLRLGRGVVAGPTLANRVVFVYVDNARRVRLVTDRKGRVSYQGLVLKKGTSHLVYLVFKGTSDLRTSTSHKLTVRAR